jgi:hypothetical protein
LIAAHVLGWILFISLIVGFVMNGHYGGIKERANSEFNIQCAIGEALKPFTP